jgi:hypothetical protein
MNHSQLRNIIKEEISNALSEAKMSPRDLALKKKYIDDYMSYVVDPYEYEGTSIDNVENHAKKFGYENTLRTIDKMDDVDSSRDNSPSADPLKTKQPGHSISNLMMRDPMKNLTKKGKMSKLDIDRIKMKIKQNLGL